MNDKTEVSKMTKLPESMYEYASGFVPAKGEERYMPASKLFVNKFGNIRAARPEEIESRPE